MTIEVYKKSEINCKFYILVVYCICSAMLHFKPLGAILNK